MMNKTRGLIAACWLLALTGATPQELQRFEFSHPQMGTLFQITLYANDEALARQAAVAAFARIDTLNAIFSDYRSDSELSRLSATAGTGEFQPVSSDLWAVLVLAQQLAEYSGGAFDMTIGPLSRLWRRAFRRQEFPEAAWIDSARSLVGFHFLELDPTPQAVRLAVKGMRLDAGGIAKGYAVDQAMVILNDFGIRRALVDGGGDLLAGEPPPGTDGWRILLPGNGESTVELLRNGALATSGDTYRYLEWEGRRYSHIIDPRTGLGVVKRPSVTVRAPDCTTADALASALNILNPEESRQLLGHFAGCSFRINTDEAPRPGN